MANWLRLRRQSHAPREQDGTETIYAAADGTLKHMDPDGNVSSVAGEGSLPDPTSEGDVLTVVSGDWAGAAPSGGSQPSGGWFGPCKINFASQQKVSTGDSWGGADGGTVTLTVNGETTAAIAFNADEAAIKAALEALPSLSTVDVSFDGGVSITTGNTLLKFEDVEATDLVVGDGSALTGEFEPYSDATAEAGDGSGKIVVEMFTPAVGDVIEDFAHAVVTAFDAADELTYTDTPDDPDSNSDGAWSNPASSQMTPGGIDLTTPSDAYDNFHGVNDETGVRDQPTALMALVANWAKEAADSNTILYNNLPAFVKTAVPIYSVLQGVASATEGEVWIWVKKSTPAPLMD